MSGYRDLTPAEAAAYAADPRNDNGTPNALHVMAFSYDSDCPNYEEHVGANIESNGGWWTGESWTDVEANAKLYPTTAEAQAVIDSHRWSSSAHINENPCRCWDGLTIDDVETWTGEGGLVDLNGFADWGPFQLQWDGEDPGEPRGFTPQEALDAITSRLEAFEASAFAIGLTLRMSNAIDTLHAFIKQVAEHGSTDLGWGQPGDCWERIVNDDPILAAFAEVHGDRYPDLTDDSTREAVVAWCKANGLGRHYGDPHCIWCLQAS